MLRALNKKGFTLVELLIVVAIIGILAAIAIPQFAAYREKAYCSQIKSDLANLAIAEEAYFTDNSAYKATTVTDSTPDTDLGIQASTGVTLVIASANTLNSFNATGAHNNCSQGGNGSGIYNWNSENGGLGGL